MTNKEINEKLRHIMGRSQMLLAPPYCDRKDDFFLGPMLQKLRGMEHVKWVDLYQHTGAHYLIVTYHDRSNHDRDDSDSASHPTASMAVALQLIAEAEKVKKEEEEPLRCPWCDDDRYPRSVVNESDFDEVKTCANCHKSYRLNGTIDCFTVEEVEGEPTECHHEWQALIADDGRCVYPGIIGCPKCKQLRMS